MSWQTSHYMKKIIPKKGKHFMKPEYKRILEGYINESKDGVNVYLSIKNVSDQPITINPGEKLFLNRIHDSQKLNHPTWPDFWKSEKVEQNATKQEFNSEKVADEVPF